MTRSKLSLIGLAAATITLSACVTKVWEANVEAPEGSYAGALDVAIGSNRSTLLLGFTDNRETEERSIFVAKHDANGDWLWTYDAPGLRLGGMPLGNQFVATDNNDAVVFAGFSLEDQSKLTKLGPDGSLLWEATFGSTAAIPLDIETVGDAMVMVAETSNGGLKLHAFSGDGNFLWSFPEQDGCPPACETDLESNNSTAKSSVFRPAEIAAIGDDILFVDGATITRLDSTGVILAQVSKETMGMTSLRDVAVSEYQIAVLGDTEQGSKVSLLNGNLSLTAEYETVINSGNFFSIALNQNSVICVATVRDNLLQVQSLGPDVNWYSEASHELNFEGLSGLNINRRNECYVSTLEPNEVSEDTPVRIKPWSSTTRIFDATGKLDDRFSLQHFVSYSVKLDGNHIYSAGQSAEYIDGDYPLDSNVATLIKHQRR